VLTGTVGLTSKLRLLVSPTVTGPVPCSGAQAPGQGTGRSQHRVHGGAAAVNVEVTRHTNKLRWNRQTFSRPG